MAISKDYDIEIEDGEKITRSNTNRDTGVTNVFYYQKAYLNVGKRNDLEFNIPLSKESHPFPPGRYNFKKRNCLFSLNRYNNLEISTEIAFANVEFPIVLIPFVEQKKAA